MGVDCSCLFTLMVACRLPELRISIEWFRLFIMRKIGLLLTIFLFICTCQMSAQFKEYKYAVLELKTGGTIVHYLSDKPKLKYDNNTITYYTDDTSIEYKTKEVSKMYFTNNESTSILNIARSTQSNISIINGFVLLNGFVPNESVEIYSVDGRKYHSYNVNPDGSLYIDLSTFFKGVYVVKSNCQSIKIIKR